jgi:SAM-dependent methyltransferase
VLGEAGFADLPSPADTDDSAVASLRDLPEHAGRCRYLVPVSEAPWTDPTLANRFVDEAYASVKGYVRTHVLHQHLLEHLPPPPARILDVGGGAGNQSFPLAQAGYDVTILDPSPAMLDKARQRLELLPIEARQRVTLLQADGENAEEAVGGERFPGVLCHGVLGYLENPEALVAQLCLRAEAGGIVSIMTGNAHAAAVRPALERRWTDALASFDVRTETGVLGVRGRADTVEEVAELIGRYGVELERWYGTWLFVDWLEFGGTTLDATDVSEVEAIANVELEASRRDPYRQLSRAFHLIGRKGPWPEDLRLARHPAVVVHLSRGYARNFSRRGRVTADALDASTSGYGRLITD